jgi:heptosyltransferase II
LGIPTVAVFGPTTLDLGYRPWQNRALVVQKDLECRPCGKHGAAKCPLGTHACMKTVRPPDVLTAIDRLLGSDKKEIAAAESTPQ